MALNLADYTNTAFGFDTEKIEVHLQSSRYLAWNAHVI